MFRTAVAAALLLIVSACSSIPAHKETFLAAGTQYATLKFVDRDPARAEAVIVAVDKAIALVSGDAVSSIPALEAEVRKAIDFTRLNAEDAILVNTLISVVRFELEARLGSMEMSGEYKVAIVKVLAWVRGAAVIMAPAQIATPSG